MTYPAYPFKSHFVTVDGQRIHYVDEGKGETLLMLHGNPTWSYLYRHVILGLGGEFRCVAPDHLGFGFSDKPARGDYSMRAHAMRLASFVDKLGLRDVTLVAQDWGGVIGLSWATRHKHLVKRLVLMNTTGFVPSSQHRMSSIKPPPLGLLPLWALKIPVLGELFVQGRNGFAKRLVPAGIHHKERLSPRTMEGYTDPYPTWGSRRAHLASVRQIPITRRHPTWRLLSEIGAELDGWNVPTQLVWGMKDPVFVPWFLEEFERRLPNHAPSVRIADASHFVQDDAPEAVTRAIRDFMRHYPVAAAEPDAGRAEPTTQEISP